MQIKWLEINQIYIPFQPKKRTKTFATMPTRIDTVFRQFWLIPRSTEKKIFDSFLKDFIGYYDENPSSLNTQDFNAVIAIVDEWATPTTTAAVVGSRGIRKSTPATWIPATIVQWTGWAWGGAQPPKEGTHSYLYIPGNIYPPPPRYTYQLLFYSIFVFFRDMGLTPCLKIKINCHSS